MEMGMKIPKQSIIYIVICLSVTLIFILWGIMPSQRTLNELSMRIVETRQHIEEQKTLQSVYQALKQGTQKQGVQGQYTRVLPLPEKSASALVQMDQFMEAVKEISRMANVELVTLAPALSSLGGNSKTMIMETAVKGDFTSLRKFLIGLGGLSSVNRIEELQIQQNPEGMELRIKFLVERA